MKFMLARTIFTALVGLRLAHDSGDDLKKFEAQMQAAMVVLLLLLAGLWLLSDGIGGSSTPFRPGYLQRF